MKTLDLLTADKYCICFGLELIYFVHFSLTRTFCTWGGQRNNVFTFSLFHFTRISTCNERLGRVVQVYTSSSCHSFYFPVAFCLSLPITTCSALSVTHLSYWCLFRKGQVKGEKAANVLHSTVHSYSCSCINCLHTVQVQSFMQTLTVYNLWKFNLAEIELRGWEGEKRWKRFTWYWGKCLVQKVLSVPTSFPRYKLARERQEQHTLQLWIQIK